MNLKANQQGISGFIDNLSPSRHNALTSRRLLARRFQFPTDVLNAPHFSSPPPALGIASSPCCFGAWSTRF